MFFMRFALDVVFIDGDGRVVRVLDSIRPWRASSLVRGAKAAIELPAGTAAARRWRREWWCAWWRRSPPR